MSKKPAIRIITCLDVTDGRVVKGVNFANLVDAGDPVEMAKIYNDEGADELTFLDIKQMGEFVGMFTGTNKQFVLDEQIKSTILKS